MVYTGILPIAKKNEAGLATVMGHEMAHATSRHGSQRVLQDNLSKTLLMGANASLALGDMEPRQKLAVMAAIGAGGVKLASCSRSVAITKMKPMRLVCCTWPAPVTIRANPSPSGSA